MPDNNARLALRLSAVTSNRDPGRYMTLVVTDIASDQRIVQMDLLGEHLLELLSSMQVGGADGLEAWIIEPADRATIGKIRGVTSRRFSIYEHDEDAIAKWAGECLDAMGAHGFRLSQNNEGKFVVAFEHYIDTRWQEEANDLIYDRQADLDRMAGPPRKS